MNALVVQNPCHKCDLGNKNQYSQESNCKQFFTIIIIILCVGVTTYTPSPIYQEYIIPSIRSWALRNCKTVCGFNHMDEMKWVEL